MKEPCLDILHPLHFAEHSLRRKSRHPSLHGSFLLHIPHVSRSPELSRAYQIGDPIRLIDWKAYARNDQLIVREEREQALARTLIVLDARDSMFWPDANVEKELLHKAVQKFHFALRVALHLLYRHLKAGDYAQLYLQTESADSVQTHKVELRYATEVLSLYQELEAGNFAFSRLHKFLRPQEIYYEKAHLIYVVSDSFAESFPKILPLPEQQLLLLHTLSAWECEDTWMRESLVYLDEKHEKKESIGSFLRKEHRYMKKIQEWRLSLEKEMQRRGVSYLLLTERTSIRKYVFMLDELLKV